ncbi:MAG: dihydropteroate synthase [Calditrichaeota bacterium]|nr:MAG: dihydropteroate synthase [Calditrichota bacterium]
MGILNVTPDSFSDGGKFTSLEKAVSQALKMEKEGADFIDIGAESTRPNSEGVSEGEELARLTPIVSELVKVLEIPISIDTTKASVAEKMLKLGAEIVNDISGFKFEPKLADVTANFNAFAILMHTRGKPQVMQQNVKYENLVGEICDYLESSVELAERKGINKIAIDPGIGFGKSFEDNFTLIRRLSEFEKFERPILVGLSRKSFLGKDLDLAPPERLEGSLAGAVASVLNGANILRVHDVAETKKAIIIADRIKGK